MPRGRGISMDVPPKPPPRIAVDPDLPQDVQNLLLEWETAEFKVSGLRELGRPPTGRSERPRPLVTRRFLATAGGTTAAVVALTVVLGWGLVAFLILMLVPIGAGGVVFLADLSRRYNAERYRLLRSAYDQYVLPEDLNEPDAKTRVLASGVGSACQRGFVRAARVSDTPRHRRGRKDVLIPYLAPPGFGRKRGGLEGHKARRIGRSDV
jgi:hypothetical protein